MDATDIVLLMLTLGAWLFMGRKVDPANGVHWIALAWGVLILAIVGTCFIQTKDSPVGQSILYSTLNVVTQMYVILQWGGDDPLLRIFTEEDKQSRPRPYSNSWARATREDANVGTRSFSSSSR